MSGSAAPVSDPRPIRPFAGPIDAVVRPPGSKSITNRAVLAAALAGGRSTLRGVLLADDTEAMLDGVSALGAQLTVDRPGRTVTIEGVAGRIAPGPVRIDARLSGTTSRFLLPTLATGVGPYGLDGAAPLRARPMGPIFAAVRALGSEVVEEGAPGHLPVTVRRERPPVPDESGPTRVSIAGDVSSQFTSGLLLAAPCRPDGLHIALLPPVVSQPYLDLTVAVMQAFGASVHRPDPTTYEVEMTGYRPREYSVEPDASAASYLFAAAAITGGRVRVEGLGTTSLQGDVAFVDVLERMGVTVTRESEAITVVGPSGGLRGVEADFADISDTAQTLAAVAVFAAGPTRVTGIGFIRRKETDRIAAVVTELRRCGIRADEEPDGFVVHPGSPVPATVQTYDDHRMAMSFALLGLRAEGIAVADPGCVAKTFPDYFDVLESLRPGPSTPADGSRSRP